MVEDEGVADGVLIYIKPACYGDDRATWMNTSRLARFFRTKARRISSSANTQFESYRMLGDFKYLEFSCHDAYEGDNNGDSVKELAPSRGEQ